jgi:hypothetical protein
MPYLDKLQPPLTSVRCRTGQGRLVRTAGAVVAVPSPTWFAGPAGLDGGHREAHIQLDGDVGSIGLRQVRLVDRAVAVLLDPQDGGHGEFGEGGSLDLRGRGARQRHLGVPRVVAGPLGVGTGRAAGRRGGALGLCGQRPADDGADERATGQENAFAWCFEAARRVTEPPSTPPTPARNGRTP